MSVPSVAANHAASVDWNIVAAALATFLGTVTVTIWGLISGKKKVEAKLEGRTDVPVQSAAILDNTLLLQQVLLQRELRDHMLIGNHALQGLCRAIEENTEAVQELTRKLN